MARISVIIPVYNTEQYLHRCLESILAQSFQSYDVILINNGSTDRSGMICDEYAQKYDNIHVIHRQTNGGVSKSRNSGLDCIAVDWGFRDRAAESTNLPLSICNFAHTDGSAPAEDPTLPSVTVCSSEDFFVTNNLNSILTWGKLYQKDLFANIRFPLGRYHEDEFTIHKLLFSTDKIAFIEAPPLYYYYKNPNGLMSPSLYYTRLDVLAAFRKRIPFLKAHHLQKAYRWQADLYYKRTYIYQQLFLKHYPNEIKKYNRILNRHYRYALRHLRLSNRISFHTHIYLYEKHYPHLMWLYWTGKGLIGKIIKRK